ncbi:MAG: PAS domain S-box protein [Gracilimonas sp.]|nr:PAS domain S-box protein [Gracilimonas sp.]
MGTKSEFLKCLQFVENFKFPALLLDSHLRIVKVNREFLKLSGWDIDKITGKSYKKVFDSELDFNSDLEDKILFDSKNQVSKVCLKLKNGTTKTLSIFISPLSEKQDKDLYLLQFTSHINEEDKKKSVPDYSNLYNKMSSGVVYHDSDGHIIDANPAAEKLLGLTIDQMKGRHSVDPHWKAIHLDQSEYPGETHPAILALKTGKPILNKTMGVYHPEKDDYVWLLVSAQPIFNQSKEEPSYVFATFIDITKQVKTDKQLQIQNKLQDLLMEISATYINLPLEKVDQTINESIAELGKYFNADRFYIFDYDFEQNTASNTFEWCAKGVKPEIDNLQDVPVDVIPEWINTHKNGKAMIIHDVLKLDKDDNVRQILEPQEIKSLITVPIMDGKECLGFLGIDSVRKHRKYSKKEEQLLHIFADFLTNLKKRVKNYESLQENKRILSDIIENSGSVIVIKDVDGKYILVNKKFEEITGIKIKEVIGKTDHELFPKETAELFRKNDEFVIDTGKTDECEEILTIEGNKRYFLSIKFPVLDNQGKISGVCAMATEITARKETTNSLEEKEQYLQNLLNTQSSYVIRTDLNGYKTYSNNKFEKDHGWLFSNSKPGNDLATNSICSYHHERTEKTVKECIEKPGKIVSVELDQPSKKGGTLTTLWEFVCLTDEKGQPNEIQCIGFDITERKEAQEKLLQSEQKYKILFNEAPEAYLILKNKRIIECNKVTERYLNGTREKIIGKKLTTFLPDTLKNTNTNYFINEMVEIAKNKGQHSFEYTFESLDGVQKETEFRLSKIPYQEEEAILAICKDLTQVIKAEKDRIARKEAEAANKAKSAFLSSMSHEIRTPLHAIIGFSQILTKDNSLNPNQIKKIETIFRNGNHLLNLIDDILDYSKIETGQITINKSSFSLKQLLADLQEMFSLQTNSKNIELNIQRELPFNEHIVSDESKVRQVLVNILSNAVKFTKKGFVKLTVQFNSDIESSGNQLLSFTVQDTGPGIHEKEIDSIFDEFKQFDAGKKAGGTGLGLTISYALANHLGGDIVIESEIGTGTNVTFNLPISSSEERNQLVPQSSEEVIKSINKKQYSILVVDDNEDILDTISEMLELEGFTSAGKKTVDEAIDYYLSHKPDVILLDLSLNQMDGYKLVTQIREKYNDNLITIIAVTATKLEKRNFLDKGLNDYIRKPFRTEKLLKIIERSLTNTTHIDDISHRVLPRNIQSKIQSNKQYLELFHKMHSSIKLGDIQSYNRILNSLDQAMPEISAYLRKLGNSYDYEKLNEVFEKLDLD